jgi:hypothetical protein
MLYLANRSLQSPKTSGQLMPIATGKSDSRALPEMPLHFYLCYADAITKWGCPHGTFCLYRHATLSTEECAAIHTCGRQGVNFLLKYRGTYAARLAERRAVWPSVGPGIPLVPAEPKEEGEKTKLVAWQQLIQLLVSDKSDSGTSRYGRGSSNTFREGASPFGTVRGGVIRGSVARGGRGGAALRGNAAPRGGATLRPTREIKSEFYT